MKSSSWNRQQSRSSDPTSCDGDLFVFLSIDKSFRYKSISYRQRQHHEKQSSEYQHNICKVQRLANIGTEHIRMNQLYNMKRRKIITKSETHTEIALNYDQDSLNSQALLCFFLKKYAVDRCHGTDEFGSAAWEEVSSKSIVFAQTVSCAKLSVRQRILFFLNSIWKNKIKSF